MNLHPYEAAEWAQKHFSGIELRDKRRASRAVAIGTALAQRPGASIPQMFGSKYEVKAAYTFFDVEEVTPEKLQAGHRKLVLGEMREAGCYLLIEDDSEFGWSNEVERRGLGKTRKKKQGFILHTTLAVRWHPPKLMGTGQVQAQLQAQLQPQLQAQREAVEVIGLAHQEYYPRIPRPEDEANQASRARKKRVRESQLWERSSQTLGTAPQDPNIRWVRVADRGADIAWFLANSQKRGHGFVVRAAQDRKLLHTSAENDSASGTLFPTIRSQLSQGGLDLVLRARPKQPARTAHLQVSFKAVVIHNPHYKSAPIACSVIRVWEDKTQLPPSSDLEPLEWVLLCDTPIQNLEQAIECILQYATRWLIEEYHKGLKSGLGADQLQLQTAARLFAAIALMAIVAVRLLHLKEAVRLQPNAPAHTTQLSALELEVLATLTHRTLSTVKDVALALGRLGGHMNRPSDGLPGWQSLWRGIQYLNTLVEGVRLARDLKSFGV